MIETMVLVDEEKNLIKELVTELLVRRNLSDDLAFIETSGRFAQYLPERVRRAMHDFRAEQSSRVLVIVNLPAPIGAIASTPKNHWVPGENRPLNSYQIVQGLLASMLGEPIGFETQQSGRIFNDLIPIDGARSNSSSGQGSIGLHTENYSRTQPYMPDFLSLAAIRNTEGAQTVLSGIRPSDLPRDTFDLLLSEPLLFANGLRQTVLFGIRDRPYLRYSAIIRSNNSTEQLAAYDSLTVALQQNIQRVTLHDGDCIFLNNALVVHGRSAFEAEQQGRGRWFSRLCIVRDINDVSHLVGDAGRRVILKQDTTFSSDRGC